MYRLHQSSAPSPSPFPLSDGGVGAGDKISGGSGSGSSGFELDSIYQFDTKTNDESWDKENSEGRRLFQMFLLSTYAFT